MWRIERAGLNLSGVNGARVLVGLALGLLHLSGCATALVGWSLRAPREGALSVAGVEGVRTSDGSIAMRLLLADGSEQAWTIPPGPRGRSRRPLRRDLALPPGAPLDVAGSAAAAPRDGLRRCGAQVEVWEDGRRVATVVADLGDGVARRRARGAWRALCVLLVPVAIAWDVATLPLQIAAPEVCWWVLFACGVPL